MLHFFKTLSVQRSGWLLLLISALALEGAALYFQYGMELQPCVMCIYERVALFSIAFAGFSRLNCPAFLNNAFIGVAHCFCKCGQRVTYFYQTR